VCTETELHIIIVQEVLWGRGYNMRSSTNPVLPAVQQRELNRQER